MKTPIRILIVALLAFSFSAMAHPAMPHHTLHHMGHHIHHGKHHKRHHKKMGDKNSAKPATTAAPTQNK